MAKRDLKKELKQLYAASAKEVMVVDVPSLNFLMVDGAGDPNTAQAYREAVEALYAASYALKSGVKQRDPDQDYVVMPLEGRWWTEDPASFSYKDRSDWRWTLMIMQPEPVTPSLVAETLAQVARKKALPALAHMRFEPFREGNAAQILHVGPYASEPPTIERLHRFIADRGGTLTGRHHELYLSDARRTAPERLKTIIRQPFI